MGTSQFIFHVVNSRQRDWEMVTERFWFGNENRTSRKRTKAQRTNRTLFGGRESLLFVMQLDLLTQPNMTYFNKPQHKWLQTLQRPSLTLSCSPVFHFAFLSFHQAGKCWLMKVNSSWFPGSSLFNSKANGPISQKPGRLGSDLYKWPRLWEWSQLPCLTFPECTVTYPCQN